MRRRRRRRRRWPIIVGLLVTVTVLVVGAVIVGEAVAKPAAERQIAASLVSRYHLTTTPKVRLRGFPFLVAAARGRLVGATVVAGPSSFEGLRVDRLDLAVGKIAFSPRDILSGGRVTVDAGVGTAIVNEAAISAYVRSLGYPIDIAIQPGQVTVSSDLKVAGFTGHASASGTLSLVGSQLSFSATSVDLGALDRVAEAVDFAKRQLSFTVTLPDVAGLALRTISLRQGAVAITADVAAQSLDT